MGTRVQGTLLVLHFDYSCACSRILDPLWVHTAHSQKHGSTWWEDVGAIESIWPRTPGHHSTGPERLMTLKEW